MSNKYRLGIALLTVLHLSFVVPAVHQPQPQQNAQTISFTTNEVVEYATALNIPCADDFVVLEGKLHVLMHVTINNNTIVVKSHYQPQGISGMGISGDKYQATGVTQDIFKGSLVNGQSSFSTINNFRIIGQGKGNNYLVQTILHTTVNANGEVTVTVDQSSFDCK